MAEPITRRASTHGGQGLTRPGNAGGGLLAPLLPAGEPVEQLLRRAQYLASLFTAGDPGPVRRVLRTLAAVRTLMRARQLGLGPPGGLAESAGAAEADLAGLYRPLAIAKYDERYVIPPVLGRPRTRKQP